MTDPLESLIARIPEVDAAAAAAAQERQGRLTKPAGSLGRLEALGERLAAMAGTCPPPVPTPVDIAVFAGDHGVLAQGVTPWPAEVTAQMVANFLGGGAAINVLARQLGATVHVVDVGVATPIPGDHAGLVEAKVAAGTRDLAEGPALTVAEARAALEVGIAVGEQAVAGGARLLVTGDMGIGNTTASAALIAALTGADPGAVTGRGTGIDDATLAIKVAVIERALRRLVPPVPPLTVLAEVGGLEIAALAGYILAGAAHRVPVVLDGVIAVAAALVARALAPASVGYCIAGHRSVEPGASTGLAALGLEPLVDLGLRLGEGSGAALAVPLVQAAAALLGQMATFESAGVDERAEHA
ncbi:MAG: nicotinate-nucleotide--dimethylbenzimidazole phosphoribosyltransferase [Acidimicrobiales bacterium]